jgi:disulfide bond formation protein DsbB
MRNYFSSILNFFEHNSFYTIILFAFLAGASLGIAYIAQYFFKIMPCRLCMYSRIPFLIMLFLPLVFLIPPLKTKAFYGLLLIAIIILVNITISFYHIGVENHWFKPSLCKLHKEEHSKYSNQLYDFLLGDETSLSSCENPTFKLFGIFTFATLTFVFSIFLFILINFFIFQRFFMKFFEK